MSLAVQETETFETDVARQFAWYLDETGEELAWRFKASVDLTSSSSLRSARKLSDWLRFRS